MEGFLCINKPAGLTSHDAVNRLRRLLGTKKIGHTGTLDPLASGVLILCVGQATRLADYIQQGRKKYLFAVTLGTGTETWDLEGAVTCDLPAGHIGPEHIRGALPCFVGEVSQTPPEFSAVKVNGMPMYSLARQGIAPEPEERRVHIYSLELEGYAPDRRHPSALLSLVCSKGTYVRSLARDIGRRLGVPATVTLLRREENAGFTLGDAVALDALEGLSAPEIEREYLLPMNTVCRFMPSFQTDCGRQIAFGQSVPADCGDSDCILALCEDRVLALGRTENNIFYPGKVFIK
ncbi:MAG: tRNA pseudouridine(55) synthase TruB [Abditibacteriota bacterium]|nr:tRNA pseudouridine(55) synthase TruB [Abditibacteriota bacterium]